MFHVKPDPESGDDTDVNVDDPVEVVDVENYSSVESENEESSEGVKNEVGEYPSTRNVKRSISDSSEKEEGELSSTSDESYSIVSVSRRRKRCKKKKRNTSSEYETCRSGISSEDQETTDSTKQSSSTEGRIEPEILDGGTISDDEDKEIISLDEESDEVPETLLFDYRRSTDNKPFRLSVWSVGGYSKHLTSRRKSNLVVLRHTS